MLHGSRSRGTRAGLAALLAAPLIALAHPPAGAASIKAAGDARRPTLRVNAWGVAEVDWTTAGGERRSLTIARSGALRYGGHILGRDVSAPTKAARIPLAKVVRRTPDGSFWALQSWRRLPGGPVELRFSRWRGAPTTLSLRTVCCKWGTENIVGTASFQGRPIYGFRSTSQGVPLDAFGRNVYLDTYRGSAWMRMMGILTHRPTGFFSLWIRPPWLGSRYRGTIIGPNWGWTLGPDAQAATVSARR